MMELIRDSALILAFGWSIALFIAWLIMGRKRDL